MSSSKVLTFNDCDCSYNFNKDGGIDVDSYNLPDCPKTWNLIGLGKNIGVFQCESFQMQNMAKKFKPTSLEDLSALIAAVRPGVSEVVLPDGMGAIDRYLAVKNDGMQISYICPQLERILAPTHSVILYQEQILEIAKELAGFTLSEADFLRKGIGKKDTAIVAECRTQFLTGAAKVGILGAKDAEELFDQIEKSARYSFNKAHSWAYADTAYITAYLKAHFPKTFMTSSLVHAKTDAKPLDEVKKVVQDARRFNIEILQPDIKLFQPITNLLAGKIRFGLSDVKDISETAAANMSEVAAAGVAELKKPFAKWTWLEFLIFFTTNQITLKSGIKYTPNSKAICNLIKVGAVDFPMYRQEMLLEYERVWKALSDGQRKWIRENYNPRWSTLAEAVEAVAPTRKNGGGSHDKEGEAKAYDLLKLMKNLPADIRDTSKLVADDEKQLIGIPLSCGSLDDNKFKASCNITCKEFLAGVNKPAYRLVGEVKSLHVITCKNGKSAGRKMAFMVLDDGTVELESITIFSDEYEMYEHLLYETSIIYVEGTRDRNRGTLIVKKVHTA